MPQFSDKVVRRIKPIVSFGCECVAPIDTV